ncbi:uncharacterized protein LOC113430529 [Notechis scutatus]|uniref:ribonuclease H n=1 Tax=Notechis scutatus TaxID=8663 RepID=A0A6J1W7E1_9SAUR|nr:uncharacterized protein LOC113430529 [Notechis scutatus]
MEVADLVKTIMDAHNPNWLDVQQLMGTLFSPEEREKIRNAISEILKPDVTLNHSLIDLMDEKYPSSNPDWDLYTDEGKTRLRDYQSLVVRAIRLAGKPVINMSKPALILQEPTESPEAFYTRLVEAYRMYTPIDPSAPENARMMTMAFISQSALDIRRKLQRLEGALGKPMSELMEVARKRNPGGLWSLEISATGKRKRGDSSKFLICGQKITPPGFAAHHPPILVEEVPMKTPVRIRQGAYPLHIMQAIQDIIDIYLEHNILVPTESPWNTPILPIPKGDGRFRPVQDLRSVNLATVTIHPVVPNPYVILGLIPQAAQWFSVIDLKDAFFTIPIHEHSQHLFAFEWENPVTGRKQQYTWTRLPQGFKNSPTLFGAALAKDLGALHTPAPDVVLQYVDDLLVTGLNEELCWDNTRDLLSLLQSLGYKASRNKAQLVLQKVRYLGYDIEQGKRTLGHERKEAICQLPRPTSRKDLRGFLGAAGFCRIWIPNFSLIAQPLYEATKGADKDPLQWAGEEEASFLSLKQALLQAPSLGLPDLEKPFQLFVDTKRNVAVGVLTQVIGTWHRPVAYLSKQLDNVAKGWPTCLKAVAGTALLTQEASKLTFGQQLDIRTPHALRSVLEMKGHLWLTNPRMLKYQAILTHNPMITITQSTSLNPATLLPEPDTELVHDCIHTIEETYASRPDMKDVPLPAPDYTLFTDGTSYLHEGIRKAGYAVVTLDEVWEAAPLPPGTSAQLAELHALTRALELADGSVWAPSKVAVMHCRGHQKIVTDIHRGNERADKFAREAAMIVFNPVERNFAVWVLDDHLRPHYSGDDMARLEALEARPEGPCALLVIVCTYTEWPECIPTRTKKATEVARALLHIIIPRYGLPSRISSDNGPEFIHKATQQLARVLGITWKLHCSFHAPSGGRVERVNRTIKDKLAKICQETHLKWTDALSLALVAVRCAPRKDISVSPFELLYGRIPNLVKINANGDTKISDTIRLQQLRALNTIVHELQRYVLTCKPHMLVTSPHDIHPGQEVWVKDWKRETLGPKWRGPYTVVMCSPLAVKVAEIRSWIHWSRVKLAAPTHWKVETCPGSPLKVILKRAKKDISPSGDTPEAVPLPTGDEEDLLSPSGDTPEAVPLPTGGEDRRTPAGVTPEADAHRTALPWRLRSRVSRT